MSALRPKAEVIGAKADISADLLLEDLARQTALAKASVTVHRESRMVSPSVADTPMEARRGREGESFAALLALPRAYWDFTFLGELN